MLYVLIFGALTLALLFIAYVDVYVVHGGPMSKEEKYVDRRLSTLVESRSGSISLKSITSFEWERVCALDTYSRREDVEQLIGMKYPDYDTLPWVGRDSYWGFLFIDRDRKVIPVRISRGLVGYVVGSGGEIRVCAGKDARFLLTRAAGPQGSYVQKVLIQD